ncbi:hypothetical protein CRUP_003263 [Coryphaenoides rupestris]|nr:hypothetical protein CRUP_003263 [Coryphaenoides rupestris]
MSQVLEGSMLSDSDSNSTKRKKRGWVDDMLDTENTPSDLIHEWSPNHKQLCLNPRDKENDTEPFVLSRRYDESLWHSVDLDGGTNMAAALQLLLGAGVRRLRCPRSAIQELQLVNSSHLSQNPEMTELNLGGCSGFSPEPLGKMLQSFSSDSIFLRTTCVATLEQLPNLQHLSLSRCYQIYAAALGGICETFPALRLLDAFGLVHDARAFSKTYEMKRVAVNKRAVSAVARPTPASVDGRSMWNRRCRLRLHY